MYGIQKYRIIINERILSMMTVPLPYQSNGLISNSFSAHNKTQ